MRSGKPNPIDDGAKSLARGMRAVAATLIVGGIVIAAMDMASIASRLSAPDAVGPPDSPTR